MDDTDLSGWEELAHQLYEKDPTLLHQEPEDIVEAAGKHLAEAITVEDGETVLAWMREQHAIHLLEELLALTAPLREVMEPDQRKDWSRISAECADLRDGIET